MNGSRDSGIKRLTIRVECLRSGLGVHVSEQRFEIGVWSRGVGIEFQGLSV